MTSHQRDYLDLAKARLDWAGAGIDCIEELVDSFLSTEPCEVVSRTKQDGNSARINYVLRIYQQPPAAIRFATGDVVHNLRATLDNLVWGVGQIFRAHNRLGLEFHGCETTFRDDYFPKISRLPGPIQEWVTSIQPYQARKNMPMLCQLHNLWNRDKHRTPTVVSTAVKPGVLDYTGDSTPLRKMVFHRVSAQKDQELMATAIVPWERRQEFHPEFPLLVAFNAQGPVGLNLVGEPEEIVAYLRHIEDYIRRRVVPMFEPYV